MYNLCEFWTIAYSLWISGSLEPFYIYIFVENDNYIRNEADRFSPVDLAKGSTENI